MCAVGNLLDYLAWRGDLSLKQVPFGAVDTLVLSALAYVHFDSIIPGRLRSPIPLGQAAKQYLSLPG